METNLYEDGQQYRVTLKYSRTPAENIDFLCDSYEGELVRITLNAKRLFSLNCAAHAVMTAISKMLTDKPKVLTMHNLFITSLSNSWGFKESYDFFVNGDHDMYAVVEFGHSQNVPPCGEGEPFTLDSEDKTKIADHYNLCNHGEQIVELDVLSAMAVKSL